MELPDFQLLTQSLLFIAQRSLDHSAYTHKSSALGLLLMSLPKNLGSFLKELTFLLNVSSPQVSQSHQPKQPFILLGSCHLRDKMFLKKGDYFLPNCMSQSKTACVLSSTGSSRENCLTLVSCLPCPCQKVPPRSTEIFLKTACKVGCLPPGTAQLHPPNFASQPTDKAPCRASSLHTVKTNLRTLSHNNHNTRTHA